MNDATGQASGSLVIAGAMFVAAGIFLMFYYRRWMGFSENLARQANTLSPALHGIMVSTPVVWLMRLIGLFALIFGALGIWLGLGQTIPSFTG